MLFAIGLVLVVVGFVWFKSDEHMDPPTRSYAAVAVFIIGAAMMLASICILAWRYLP